MEAPALKVIITYVVGAARAARAAGAARAARAAGAAGAAGVGYKTVGNVSYK